MDDKNPETEQISKPATKVALAEATIWDNFQPAFGGIYNVVDLAIDNIGKAKITKELIGNILMNTRDKCIIYVKETFK
jgi:hypothetical protein